MLSLAPLRGKRHRLAGQLGDRTTVASARTCYGEALALRQTPGPDVDLAESLERFASLAAASGRARRAVRLAAAADRLRRPTTRLPFRTQTIRSRRFAPMSTVEAA